MTLDDIIDALRSTPVVLRRLVTGLDDAALRAGHGEERWSIKEVVLHLRDAEEVTLERCTRLAREDGPVLPGYDQEAYARDRGYQDADASAGLRGFEDLRGKLLILFQSVSAADLERTGTHEEWGAVTLGGLVERMIAHDLIHLAQIAGAAP
jgi:hypothetical protein